MNVHKNAKQTPQGRERLVRLVPSGLSPEHASRLGGISPRALRKWVARFNADGVEGLIDRSSRPHHLRAVLVRRIIALRRLRWTGKHIAKGDRHVVASNSQPGASSRWPVTPARFLTRSNRCTAIAWRESDRARLSDEYAARGCGTFGFDLIPCLVH